jgi:hypothetical protein
LNRSVTRRIRRLGKRTKLQEQLHRLSGLLEREQISEYVQLLRHPWRMMMLNLVFGVVRGLGIALGFTIFTTIVVWFLNWLGALELPLIGDYIADLVQAVQDQLENRRF